MSYIAITLDEIQVDTIRTALTNWAKQISSAQYEIRSAPTLRAVEYCSRRVDEVLALLDAETGRPK